MAVAHELVRVTGNIHNHVGFDVPIDTHELRMHVVISNGKQGVADTGGNTLGGQYKLFNVIGIGCFLREFVSVECHCVIVTIKVCHLDG